MERAERRGRPRERHALAQVRRHGPLGLGEPGRDPGKPERQLPRGLAGRDLIGADLYASGQSGGAQPAFCTKVRLTRLKLFPDPTNNNPNTIRTLRAEIRVYWERAGIPVDCSPGGKLPDPETHDNNHLASSA